MLAAQPNQPWRSSATAFLRVTRRTQAEADILEIWSYIAEDSFVEADRWVDRLSDKFALWATQPSMGRKRDELAPGFAA